MKRIINKNHQNLADEFKEPSEKQTNNTGHLSSWV